MSSKKSKAKNKNRESENIAKDMWQNLLNNPYTPNTNTHLSGSSSQTSGFANLPPIANPFNIAPEDPRNNYQHQGWYQNPQFSPQQSQWPQWSPQQHPHFSQPSQFSQPPQFSPPTQFRDVTFEDSSDEAPPEPEPEPVAAEPEPTKNKGKRVQIRWDDDDARILAERWIHCSENGVQGNSQTNESFWKQVQKGFNSLVTEKRNINQLTGKWNKISHDVKAFQALYKRHKEMCPQSGADENDVLNATRAAFKNQAARRFIYESAWNVLRYYPKFFAEPGVMGNEDRFEPFVTNLEENEEPTPTALDSNMKRLFADDPLRRPPGRKSAKSAASSDAGSSSRSSVQSEKLEALEAVKQAALMQQKAIEAIQENSLKKVAYKALSFLCKKIPKRASKKELKMIKNARKEVVNLYKDKYGGDDSDDEQEDETVQESSSD